MPASRRRGCERQVGSRGERRRAGGPAVDARGCRGDPARTRRSDRDGKAGEPAAAGISAGVRPVSGCACVGRASIRSRWRGGSGPFPRTSPASDKECSSDHERVIAQLGTPADREKVSTRARRGDKRALARPPPGCPVPDAGIGERRDWPEVDGPTGRDGAGVTARPLRRNRGALRRAMVATGYGWSAWTAACTHADPGQSIRRGAPKGQPPR